MVMEGGANRFVFETYVERFLAPSLSAAQMVLLDDLGAHETKKARELIKPRDEGAVLAGLPAGPQPHRGGVQQGEHAPQEGGGLDQRGARGSDSPSACGRHHGGRASLFSHSGFELRDRFL